MVKRTTAWKRCTGSGASQMLAWMPDPKEDYPGAVVCLGCSFGVLIKKGSDHPATSQSGYEGTAGTVRAHDVKRSVSNREPEKMRYVT